MTTLTYKMRSNSETQTIIAKVGATGLDHLKQTENNELMPFGLFDLGNENVSLQVFGEKIRFLKRDQIVKMKLTNVKKIMRGYWEAYAENIEIIVDV